jgi:hypothetical protein
LPPDPAPITPQEQERPNRLLYNQRGRPEGMEQPGSTDETLDGRAKHLRGIA